MIEKDSFMFIGFLIIQEVRIRYHHATNEYCNCIDSANSRLKIHEIIV